MVVRFYKPKLQTLSKMIKEIAQWFLYSSKNPQEFALTLKAGLPLLALLGLDNFISTDDAGELIDTISNVAFLLLEVGTGVATAYGILRKVFLTVKKAIK